MSFYGVHAVLADVNGVLSKSPYGHSLKNISEQAISHGKSAGVVSSVPFSHATPSAPASWARRCGCPARRHRRVPAVCRRGQG
ncbi:hypothetical protein FQN05_10375 [Corynebacterium aurimucosum]|uniref:Uncharacterized protein n=1 Tax=Corynebacterium aurimucosum TaxID=169292 RepID=A0A558IL24_9CORY|nr:hypothetical protein FQN05_10375 [Corynebacterium aurimucosum]